MFGGHIISSDMTLHASRSKAQLHHHRWISSRISRSHPRSPNCDHVSCACPGRLEVSRGIVEAKHVTSGRHPSSAADLTNTNSCQLKSTHVTPTNCSRVTSTQVEHTCSSSDEWSMLAPARASGACLLQLVAFEGTQNSLRRNVRFLQVSTSHVALTVAGSK